MTSTQDLAEAIYSMVDGDFIVTAKLQTKARGRFGRSWYSPPGGLWFTYVKKSMEISEVPLMTFEVSLSVRRSIQKLLNPDQVAMIRWPNDVVVNDLKVAGILLEAHSQGTKGTVFIGAGVDTNVTDFPSYIRATSIFKLTGRPIDNRELLKDIIVEIERGFHRPTKEVREEMDKYLSIKGRLVEIHLLRGSTVKAKVEGLDDNLSLVTDGGTFSVNDISRLDVA